MRTPEEWVEEVETAMSAIITGGVSSYSIAGRSFTKHNLNDLQRLYDFWVDRSSRRRNGIATYADMTTSTGGADE